MSYQFREEDDGRLLEVEITGTLSDRDYKRFVPEFQRLARKHAKINVLLEMHKFHGWELGGLWQEFKFDLEHLTEIERLAMVGERNWEEWAGTIRRPFTHVEIRYFDHADVEQARTWVKSQPAPERMAA